LKIFYIIELLVLLENVYYAIKMKKILYIILHISPLIIMKLVIIGLKILYMVNLRLITVHAQNVLMIRMKKLNQVRYIIYALIKLLIILNYL